MKNILIIAGLLTVKILAYQKYTAIINANNVKVIELNSLIGNNIFSRKITEPEKIQMLLFELNKAKRELSVFKKQYTLRIIYCNGVELLIICNGNRMKVNGLTYQLNKPIYKIVDFQR